MNIVISVSDHIICAKQKTKKYVLGGKKMLTQNYCSGNFCSSFPLFCSFSFALPPRVTQLSLNTFTKGAKTPRWHRNLSGKDAIL